MTSIYREALGADFERLHPRIQDRFGFSSRDGIASVGTGTMDEIRRGWFFTVPFLMIGSWRRVLFPETGTDVPFTVRNYAYRDSFGRETVTWIREFRLRRTRRFDAYMVYSPERGCILDYFGTHCHLVAELHLAVDERGGIRMQSGAQRIHERALSFRVPLILSGRADIVEWFDDADQRFHIEVEIRNRLFGRLFSYRGSFTAETVQGGTVPADLLPKREEART